MKFMKSMKSSDWYNRIEQDDKYEYAYVIMPRDLSVMSAKERFAIGAQFSGWELSRLRKYADGTRRVILRRRKTPSTSPAVLMD